MGTTLFTLLGKLAIEGTDEAKRELQDVSNEAEQSEGKMTSAFKKIGGAIVAYFAIDRIKDFGVAIVNASAEVAAEEAAFSQIMGTYSDEATKKIEKIADATGIVDSRLTPYMTSLTAKFKGLGYDVDDATNLASTGLNIAADAAAFWDKSLDDSMGALNSFVNGNYEGGEAIGLFANETTLATWASDNLNLTWKDLTEKEKQFARLEFAKAMQEASGATGQAAKESGAYANVQGNLTEAWRQFKSEVGEPLLQNVVLPVMMALSDFIMNTLIPGFQWLKEKVGEVTQFYKDNKDTIDTILVVLGLFATALGVAALAMNAMTIATKLHTLASTIATSVTTAFGAAMAFLTSPITLVALGIAALIAVIYLLIKNWDDVKAAAQKTWEAMKKAFSKVGEWFNNNVTKPIANAFKTAQDKVSSVFDSIKKGISNAFDFIKGIVDKLKGLFNFKFTLPSIKVPKFSITPSGWKVGDLLKGSIPKLGVTWNAEGAIFTKPTIFDTRLGYQGVGEKGAEAIAPIDKLMSYTRQAVNESNEGFGEKLDYLIGLLSNYMPLLANRQVVLSTGELVGAMVNPMDKALGDLAIKKGRGY
jgi:hypothetical protein